MRETEREREGSKKLTWRASRAGELSWKKEMVEKLDSESVVSKNPRKLREREKERDRQKRP